MIEPKFKTQLEKLQSRPAHAGDILEEQLEFLGMTAAEAGTRLGIPEETVQGILHGTAPVTPEIARRLGVFFQNGDGEFWLRVQWQVDLWDFLHVHKPQDYGITPLERTPATNEL